MQRAAALPRVRPLPRPPRVLLWAVLVLLVLGGIGLWVRSSPLVAVRRVTVTGLTGPQASHIRTLLDDAAMGMSTLHVDEGRLRAAVAAYPTVKDLTVARKPPHGLTISVRENVAVAAVLAGHTKIPVAGDGRLLPGASMSTLPVVPGTLAATGNRVGDRAALQVIAVLAAAPTVLRDRVVHGGVTAAGGLTLALRDGPELRFGGADRLVAKWAAAAAVLADKDAAGATYLDVRYPERPAAGGLENPATQLNPLNADSASSTTATAATATDAPGSPTTQTQP